VDDQPQRWAKNRVNISRFCSGFWDRLKAHL
jgi:hypothetical protein